ELFASRKNSQHCRIGLRYPATKRVSADEDNHASQQTLEKVENGDCADTHEIEEGPLDRQIRERFVQALENFIAPSVDRFVHDCPLHRTPLKVENTDVHPQSQ